MATAEVCECGDSPLRFARSVVRKSTLGAFYQNGRHDRCNDLLRTSRGSAIRNTTSGMLVATTISTFHLVMIHASPNMLRKTHRDLCAVADLVM